jgi:hypothetical protein
MAHEHRAPCLGGGGTVRDRLGDVALDVLERDLQLGALAGLDDERLVVELLHRDRDARMLEVVGERLAELLSWARPRRRRHRQQRDDDGRAQASPPRR